MTPTSARPQGLLPRTDTDAWWRDAVIYQIYPRSFADANGDGIGDIQGIREHVDHLVALGVDAVWLSPFYPSPQVDAGYDVSDYFDLAPEYGSLQDLDALIADLHEAGIRVIVDLVPNHSSDQHAWFRAALEAGPGSPERDRYIFRHSDDGAPNNWGSLFGGPAWQPVEPLTGRSEDRGWYYLHLFAAEQPDFNWSNADVHEHFRTFLRFWVERGIEGFRVDVAHGLVKAEGLPDDDLGPDRWNVAGSPDEDAAHEKLPDVGPAFNQPGVHDIYREWRRVLDEVGEDILLVAEAWVPTEADAAQYVRADEMSQAFNFPFLGAGWDADALRRVIDVSLSEYGAVGAPATWVLSNHDVVRHASRLAYPADMDTDPGIGPRTPNPTPSSAWPERAPPPCSCWGCPAAPTSTRARSSDCPSTPPWRTRPARTPCGSAPTTSYRGATAAGSPCPGRGTGPPTATTPPAAPGCLNPRVGASTRPRPRRDARTPPSPCTGGPSPCAASSDSGAGQWSGWTVTPGSCTCATALPRSSSTPPSSR